MGKSAADIFVKRLKELREKHNLTQEEFSELSGIGYKYVQHLESGRRRDVRLSTIERVAQVYGLQAHQILSPKVGPTRLKVRAKR